MTGACSSEKGRSRRRGIFYSISMLRSSEFEIDNLHPFHRLIITNVSLLPLRPLISTLPFLPPSLLSGTPSNSPSTPAGSSPASPAASKPPSLPHSLPPSLPSSSSPSLPFKCPPVWEPRGRCRYVVVITTPSLPPSLPLCLPTYQHSIFLSTQGDPLPPPLPRSTRPPFLIKDL